MRIKISSELHEKIVLLRKNGNSISEISSKLNLPKTTIFHHIKGVSILPQFTTLWKTKRGGSIKRKLFLEKEARNKAEAIVTNLSGNEKLYFLCALYWAEGSKNDFGLSNTDPKLIKTFIEILRTSFKISPERFRISIRIYEDLNEEQCLEFWSKITGIPKKDFVSVDTLSGKKVGKLPYGMCRVRILKGGTILKEIKAINSVIFEQITSPRSLTDRAPHS